MNKTKMKNLMINNKNKGFSIIEAMVAIFILTFSITVLMSVVANSIFQSRYAKNEITATYLAQEVIDYIRNDRDSNIDNWTNFISQYDNCINSSCTIDVPTSNINSCYSNTCPNFYYNENVDNGSFYNYNNSGSLSSFRRTVNIIMNNSDDEMIVNVSIDWKNKSNSSEKSLEMKSSLLNWY